MANSVNNKVFLDLDGQDELQAAMDGMRPGDEATMTVRVALDEMTPGKDATFSIKEAEFEEPMESETEEGTGEGEASGMGEGMKGMGQMMASMPGVRRGRGSD